MGGRCPASRPWRFSRPARRRGIVRDLDGSRAVPFRYHDPGNLATIGRAAAVADLGWIRFAGWLAWVFWLFVHILKLTGFRNRLVVFVQWAWAYFTYQRSIRLITGRPGNPPRRGVMRRIRGRRTPRDCVAAVARRCPGRRSTVASTVLDAALSRSGSASPRSASDGLPFAAFDLCSPVNPGAAASLPRASRRRSRAASAGRVPAGRSWPRSSSPAGTISGSWPRGA